MIYMSKQDANGVLLIYAFKNKTLEKLLYWPD